MAEDDFLVRRQRQLSQKAEQEALATRRKAALRSLARCIREMRENGLSDDQIAGELRAAASGIESASNDVS